MERNLPKKAAPPISDYEAPSLSDFVECQVTYVQIRETHYERMLR